MATQLDKDPNVSSVSGSATLSGDQAPQGPNADEFTPEGGVKEAEQEEAKKAAQAEVDGGDDESGYQSMTADQLQDELRSRDLPVSGNKDELIARLEENDAGGNQ